MIKQFTYPIPDDNFVEGISGKRKVTYTYEGPEKLFVLVNSDGIVYKVDPDIDNLTDEEKKELVEIDANQTPEVAFFFGHILLDVFDYKYEFDEEILENGDVYAFPKNPLLWDAYYLLYDFKTSEWIFKQILKPLYKPGEEIVNSRIKLLNFYLGKYDFSSDLKEEILDYISSLESYLDNCQEILEWKYTHLPIAENIPKIPINIAAEINKLPEENLK